MRINVSSELKPLVANLIQLGFGYYLQTPDFDNLMLEYNYDEAWSKSLDAISVDDGIIYVGNTNDHEDAFFYLFDLLWKNNKKKVFQFLKISIIGFVETIETEKDFSKMVKRLEQMEIPVLDLEEIKGALTVRVKKRILNIERKELMKQEPKNLIFIGHGRSLLWREVEAFLNEEKLTHEAFETYSRTSLHIVDVLKEMLDKAGFAIIVVTAEDPTEEGGIRARQNVVHEIGLFQGRLGFDKVVILKQQGVEEFTNIAGLQYIPFAENIRQSFHDLRRYLRQAGLLS